MLKLNVYLSGSVKNADDSFQSWRKTFLKKVKDKNCYHLAQYINAIDPISHYNYTDHKPKTDKECHDLFYYYIDKSDVLIVNLDQSNNSPGTVSEVHHAYMKGIPVIGFGTNKDTWYNWAALECSMICDDMDEVINNLYTHFGVV